jgi:hypothetical protein
VHSNPAIVSFDNGGDNRTAQAGAAGTAGPGAVARAVRLLCLRRLRSSTNARDVIVLIMTVMLNAGRMHAMPESYVSDMKSMVPADAAASSPRRLKAHVKDRWPILAGGLEFLILNVLNGIAHVVPLEGRHRLSRAAVFALGGEEVAPRHHLGVQLKQRAALTLRHTAPYAELDPVVQRVGAALEDHRTMPADHHGFALRGAAHEQLIGIGFTTAGFGHPGHPVIGLRTADWAPRCLCHDAAFTYSWATRFTHCLASSRLYNGRGSGRN